MGKLLDAHATAIRPYDNWLLPDAPRANRCPPCSRQTRVRWTKAALVRRDEIGAGQQRLDDGGIFPRTLDTIFQEPS